MCGFLGGHIAGGTGAGEHPQADLAHTVYVNMCVVCVRACVRGVVCVLYIKSTAPTHRMERDNCPGKKKVNIKKLIYLHWHICFYISINFTTISVSSKESTYVQINLQAMRACHANIVTVSHVLRYIQSLCPWWSSIHNRHKYPVPPIVHRLFCIHLRTATEMFQLNSYKQMKTCICTFEQRLVLHLQ